MRFQIPTIETENKAHAESFSQAGPWILMYESMVLMIPCVGSNKYLQTTPDATVGVTTGKK